MPKIRVFFNRFIETSYKNSGFDRNEPTMDVNSFKHQAFIMSKNTCPASIRHQEEKMLEVDFEAPQANAIGAVYIITPSKTYRSAASNSSLI